MTNAEVPSNRYDTVMHYFLLPLQKDTPTPLPAGSVDVESPVSTQPKMIVALSIRAMSRSLDMMARAIDCDSRETLATTAEADLTSRVNSLEGVVGEVHQDSYSRHAGRISTDNCCGTRIR